MDNDTKQEIPVLQSPLPDPQQQAKPRSIRNKYLPVVIAVGIIMLMACFVILKANKKETSIDQPTPTVHSSQKQSDKQQFTAKQLADYGQVCKGGVAVNAASYQDGPRPHPITLFTQSRTNPDNVSELYLSFENSKWQTDLQKVETAQLIGCFKYKSEGPSKKCEYSRITLDYFAVTYELTVHEAKTGKAVGTKEVNGPNLTCPSYASYDLDDPKIYAKPDTGLAEEAIREFVTH